MAITYPLTDLEKKAWDFAKKSHSGVKRKFQNSEYFDGHVAKVFGFVKQFDTRPEIGAAALLHDTIEDVDDVTYEVILNEFGKRVADLVKELTSNEEMIDIMSKSEYLLDKMITMSDDALIIKLCDRLHNISDFYASSEKFRSNYYSETKFIIENLSNNRHLNRKQKRVIDRINGILDNIKKRYKYEKYISSYKNFLIKKG